MQWVVPDEGRATFERWAAEHSLDREWVFAGELVDRNRRREVRCLRSAAAPTLFVKVHSGRGHRRRATAEARHCRRLGDHGLAVPPVVAWAIDRAESYLILEEVGQVDLDQRLAVAFSTAAARRRFLQTLGLWLRSLHDAGFEHGQCFAWHVRVDEGTENCWVLDVAESRLRRGTAGERARIDDLAALLATLPFRILSRCDRLRLLRAYCALRSRRPRWHRRLSLALARSHRSGRSPRPEPGEEWRVEPDRVWVAADRAAEVRRLGIENLDQWIAPKEATLLRARDGRQNWRWDGAPGEPDRGSWFGKCFVSHIRGRRVPAAVAESRSLATARWLDLPVPRVVLLARRKRERSVFWTRGVRPGTMLLEILRTGTMSKEERRRVSCSLARWVARLHAHGFVHQDLYLDHFLADASTAKGWCWIDWGRLERRGSERARIKDLAALEYSAGLAGVTRTERLRWFRVYAGGFVSLRLRGVSGVALRSRRRLRRWCRRAGRKAAKIATREQRRALALSKGRQ